MVLATTIHGYVPQLLAFGRPLHVWSMATTPNYPRSYIDSYDPRVVFECRADFSALVIHHGRACTASSPILEPARMNGPSAMG